MTPTDPCFEAAAIILAGGESRRMGQNKCLLPYRGVPLIQHVAAQLVPRFQQVSVSTNMPEAYAFLGLPMVPDQTPDRGPLMGIVSSLTRSQHGWNFVVAADIPELPHALISELYEKREGHNCVVPRTSTGHFQPLFAFYHRSLLRPMEACLDTGKHRAIDGILVADRCELQIDEKLLANLNTPEDYANANR